MLEAVLVLSVAVERVTEWFFGVPFDKFPKLSSHKWLLMYISAGIGILAALQFGLDLLTVAGLPGSVLGEVLTGATIGGGTNLVHQVFPKASGDA